MLRLLASPTDKRKVRVRITNQVPGDSLGDCTQYDKYYLIRLNKKVIERSPDVLYLLLAHEWGHALVWGDSLNNHDDAWGIASARAWRIISGDVSLGDIVNAGLDKSF